ncbi:hypothetical protein GGI25_003021 [Coemansia spiralis]|uniref:Arrestin-like N-terminal domain-containing protein n=2 Tax=Coemansia TaxID=4863 RepID=A0A9W8G7J2_9FUNG|nr:hypothetical protein EDC05_002982 [Coemansia umbellata]KAJ2622027.1 hypothetical protein GGI26_003603 [Coemansia sp. RSA 1358]KAJ2677631.1 hypothetical protein GGI25_003021 [Coemansia spiralis]
MVFGSLYQQSKDVVVTVNPLTTQIVLQQGASDTNVLVGYVSVVANRPTSISSLDVSFMGAQQLDIRAGVGPSGTLYSVDKKCANLTQQLVRTDSPLITKVVSLGLARVTSRTAISDAVMSPPPEREDNTLDEQLNSDVLMPGEYRFAFEFTLPASLPASVGSQLGGVSYRLTAALAHKSWFHSRTWAKPVSIEVFQAPPLQGGGTGALANPATDSLLGYPSLSTLTSTPLLFETQVDGRCNSNKLKVSVYSPNSSRALFLDTMVKLQVYATQHGQAKIELLEFSVALHECITHTVSGAKQTTRRVVTESSLCPRSKSSVSGFTGALDPQTIDALGESFGELPSVGSLDLLLPSKAYLAGSGERKYVQPSSRSPMFAVSHMLHVAVSVREGDCAKPSRVSFSSPVIVLPEVLSRGGSQVAVASLPCYCNIANDVVLASSASSTICGAGESIAHANPPEYTTAACE